MFDSVHLLWGQMGQQFGQEADQVENDDECSVEIGDVSVTVVVIVVISLSHGFLTCLDLLNGLLKHGHNITKVDRWTTGVQK